MARGRKPCECSFYSCGEIGLCRTGEILASNANRINASNIRSYNLAVGEHALSGCCLFTPTPTPSPSPTLSASFVLVHRMHIVHAQSVFGFTRSLLLAVVRSPCILDTPTRTFHSGRLLFIRTYIDLLYFRFVKSDPSIPFYSIPFHSISSRLLLPIFPFSLFFDLLFPLRPSFSSLFAVASAHLV